MAVLGCWKIASLIEIVFYKDDKKCPRNEHFGGKLPKMGGGNETNKSGTIVKCKKGKKKGKKYRKLAILL